MKEHPILFSTPMVRAILDGNKTQTRRIVKPQPPENDLPSCPEFYHPIKYDRYGDMIPGEKQFGIYGGGWDVKCPYGKPGDRLWVRETFCIGKVVAGEDDDWYISQCKDENDIIYKEAAIREGIGLSEVTWKPSIFMPRSASRITLEITGVRVERLQDISDDDALAEGIEPGRVSHVLEFMELWDSINADRGYGWSTNPWVWVIEFKKTEGKQ